MRQKITNRPVFLFALCRSVTQQRCLLAIVNYFRHVLCGPLIPTFIIGKKSCLRRNICPEVSCSTVAYAVQTWHRQKNMLNRTIVTDPINQLEASENELSATMDSHPVAVSASVRVIIFAGFPPLQTCARRPSVCCQINHLEAEDN